MAEDIPVTWVIERSPDFEDTARVFERVARKIEIGGGADGLDELPSRPGGPCAAFGTLRQMSTLARHPEWGHSVFDDYARLRCSEYYGHVYEELGRLTLLAPLSALPRMDLRRIFGDRLFIRPDANTKPFAGQVVEMSAVPAFVKSHSSWRNSLVALSEVIDIRREWRVFCGRGVAFADSSYPDEPFEPAPSPVISYAEGVARKLGPTLGLTMLTLDVAELASGELVLVEAGGVNGWGLYGADLDAFIAGMEREARQQFRELWDFA